MPCDLDSIPGAILCTRGGKGSRTPCSVCKRAKGSRLCDGPAPAGVKRRTCDAPLCAGCTRKGANLKQDFCPQHDPNHQSELFR